MLKIQSVSDIITNSSSEVFLIETETIKEFIENKKLWYPIIFNSLDDIREFLEKEDFLEGFDCVFGSHPYATDYFDINEMMESLKKIHTKDEIWDFYSPLYKDLVGKTLFIIDNNYSDDLITDLRIHEKETGKKVKIVAHDSY